MSWFTVAWIVWVLFFVVLEVVALRNKQRGDTLSAQVWFVLRSKPMWFIALGAFVWLGLHFFGFGFV